MALASHQTSKEVAAKAQRIRFKVAAKGQDHRQSDPALNPSYYSRWKPIRIIQCDISALLNTKQYPEKIICQ